MERYRKGEVLVELNKSAGEYNKANGTTSEESFFQRSIGYSVVSALSNICRSESGALHMIPTLP